MSLYEQYLTYQAHSIKGTSTLSVFRTSSFRFHDLCSSLFISIDKNAMQALVECGYKDELSIDSTNVLVAGLKPLYWALWPL